ncbi:MAG: hypothetical protein ABL916_17635 [Burkholderiaceae bacterium]
MRDGPFVLDDIDVDESDTIAFEFGKRLAAGESIATVTLEVAAVAGVDAGASGLAQGLPLIVGTDVLQNVIARSQGVTYKLRCRAVKNTGRVLVSAALLRVVRL